MTFLDLGVLVGTMLFLIIFIVGVTLQKFKVFSEKKQVNFTIPLQALAEEPLLPQKIKEDQEETV